jgi:hypothetical protein
MENFLRLFIMIPSVGGAKPLSALYQTKNTEPRRQLHHSKIPCSLFHIQLTRCRNRCLGQTTILNSAIKMKMIYKIKAAPHG